MHPGNVEIDVARALGIYIGSDYPEKTETETDTVQFNSIIIFSTSHNNEDSVSSGKQPLPCYYLRIPAPP